MADEAAGQVEADLQDALDVVEHEPAPEPTPEKVVCPVCAYEFTPGDPRL